jgi:hypothetical protein
MSPFTDIANTTVYKQTPRSKLSSQPQLSQNLLSVLLSLDIFMCILNYVNVRAYYDTCQLLFKFKKKYVKYKLNIHYSLMFKNDETFRTVILERISNPHTQLILHPLTDYNNNYKGGLKEFYISDFGTITDIKPLTNNIKTFTYHRTITDIKLLTNIKTLTYRSTITDIKPLTYHRIITNIERLANVLTLDLSMCDNTYNLDFSYNKQNKKFYKQNKKSYKHIPKKSYKHIPKKSYKQNKKSYKR